MKTTQDLFAILAEASIQNDKSVARDSGPIWFFHFFGHVNKIEITYHQTGWKRDAPECLEDKAAAYLNEDGIQELYWFVKNRLAK